MIIRASRGLRPDRTSSSITPSRLAESLLSMLTMGSSSSKRSPQQGWAKSASRARIQLMLPTRVLISPLWPTSRMGCASGHLGMVLVLKRR
jgi:hypothetical protein